MLPFRNAIARRMLPRVGVVSITPRRFAHAPAAIHIVEEDGKKVEYKTISDDRNTDVEPEKAAPGYVQMTSVYARQRHPYKQFIYPVTHSIPIPKHRLERQNFEEDLELGKYISMWLAFCFVVSYIAKNVNWDYKPDYLRTEANKKAVAEFNAQFGPPKQRNGSESIGNGIR